jgi:AraC-like DNA-binding protein
MKLYIKNMVCSRCIMVVTTELEKIGYKHFTVILGEVNMDELNTDIQKEEIESRLKKFGFELINDKNSRTINKIKTLIIDLVQNKHSDLKTNLSNYLSDQIHIEYNSLSSLFSDVENITIEKYFINQKIEKVKELIIYDEMSLSEIAYLLNYSSVSHLSHQFKKVTGFSPSYFKTIKTVKRKQIEDL